MKSNGRDTNGHSAAADVPEKIYTGRTIALLADTKGADRKFGRIMGIKVAHSSDFGDSGASVAELSEDEGLILDEIGVAILPAAPGAMHTLRNSSAGPEVIASEPEQIMHSTASPYWAGYRDGVNTTVDRLLNGAIDEETDQAAAALNESLATWGLQLTRVTTSSASGRGIRVAVLDTGFDLEHSDFRGRAVFHRSFIAGEQVQDGNGHGTHCIGTACGALAPQPLPRYGIAHQSEILAGKVLSNAGSGPDRGILAGIDWAVTNGASVISMSLGSPVLPGEAPSEVYEQVAARLLQRGVLIVAAAGNDSRRPTAISPVNRPANCPSIMSVGAVDQNLKIAFFSNRGSNPNGGAIDIVAPGVGILSSVPMSRRVGRLDGTSMATPHVAGIAALYAQNTGLKGAALWMRLSQTALRLPLPSSDCGIGLVQAS